MINDLIDIFHIEIFWIGIFMNNLPVKDTCFFNFYQQKEQDFQNPGLVNDCEITYEILKWALNFLENDALIVGHLLLVPATINKKTLLKKGRFLP
jgi:hypothetical protein